MNTTRLSNKTRFLRNQVSILLLAPALAVIGVVQLYPAVYSISEEQLIAQDPEVIVLGDAIWGVCPADVAARPGWQVITAVRDGAIRLLRPSNLA